MPPSRAAQSPDTPPLPRGVQVLERGWLSANNIVLSGRHGTALIDSGYATHAEQTLALVESALGARPLDQLLNTHLHSDHCGGNAALQARYPALETAIPPGPADAVAQWDADALTYAPTGQTCPQFRHDRVLVAGSVLPLGEQAWEVHAAPGHDPDSVIFFEPASRTLISADALWENGFGVVFPELEGLDAFDHVAQTLDLIERLAPRTVVPGHGPVFHHLAGALDVARRRLDGFVQSPERHAVYAAKVLLKFKLLEWQRVHALTLAQWAAQTPYLRLIARKLPQGEPFEPWVQTLLADLLRSGAARQDGDWIVNA